MISMVDTELVGRAKREQDPPRRKDRKAAVRYGSARMNPRRRPPRPGQWTPTLMEKWALDNGRFIGVSVQADEAESHLLPHERPELVRLGALAQPSLPGGVLVENLNDLDAPGQRPLARAVLARFLQKGDTSQDPPLWYGLKWTSNNRAQVRQATAKEVDSWVNEVGRSTVGDEVEIFTQAVLDYLVGTINGDDSLAFFTDMGSGSLRDSNLAKKEYQRLSGPNSDVDITRYLETYGYINPAGTVGRWYHNQLKSLHDNT